MICRLCTSTYFAAFSVLSYVGEHLGLENFLFNRSNIYDDHNALHMGYHGIILGVFFLTNLMTCTTFF